jgi:hypothetical protein
MFVNTLDCYFRAQFTVEAGFFAEEVLGVRKIFNWIGISAGALLVIAFVVLSVMAGGPKDALYMVRYALPHMHRGNLKVGDSAPDARVYALDGAETFHIRERTGAKPLVVIFGSFT